MELRAYQPADLEEIYQLFYDTVHSVNRKDYGLEQLDAWAPRQMDRPGGNNPWRIMKPGWLGKMERSLALAIWVRGAIWIGCMSTRTLFAKGLLPLCWPGWRNPLRARAAAAFIRRRLSLPGRFSSAGVTR